jgi:serine/threonine protein kinase
MLKLCDFGLAADVGPSPLYDLCGAAAFLAPEILSQTGSVKLSCITLASVVFTVVSTSLLDYNHVLFLKLELLMH